MNTGIDVSLYDKVVGWPDYARDNMLYAFIKVSEGIYEDVMFQDQWRASKGYVWRGPYHFYRPLVSWKTAADKMLSFLAREGLGELPPVLDLEAINGVANDKICTDCLHWLEYVHRQTGQRPIVYTSPGFSNTIRMYRYPDFADYDLWQATYPWDTISSTWTEANRRTRIYEVLTGAYPYPFPVAARPWQDVGRPVTFVQWTGKCPPEYITGYPLGDKKAVDVNFCRDAVSQMIVRYNLPKLEGGIVSAKPITWMGDLKAGLSANLRVGAGTSFGIKRTVTAPLSRVLAIKGTGVKIHNGQDGYYWGEVVSIDGFPESGFFAFTTSFGPITWLSEPPPPPSTTPKIVKVVTHIEVGGQIVQVETFPK